MTLDDLFQQAAGLDEPPAPTDVLARVQRQQRRRRAGLAMIGAPAAVAVVVLAVQLVPAGGGSPSPVATAPSAPARPTTYVGVANGHAVQRTATTLVRDFGPASAAAPSAAGTWVALKTGTCTSKVQLFDAAPSSSFVPSGFVRDLAASPDGRWLAYGRGAGADPGAPEDGCGQDSLVIRDLSSGHERVWPGTGGGISSLSWAPDSRRLVFQTVICCDRSTTLFDLDIATNARPVDQIRQLAVSELDANQVFLHDPAFAGAEILLLASDFAPDQRYRVVTSDGATVTELNEEGESLAADVSGQHLLIALYGSPEVNGALMSITRGQPATTLGQGFSSARWSASSSPTPASPTATAPKSTGEPNGVVKAPPTVRLAESDEFGLVVRAAQVDGSVRATVDRVDSLTGEEGERAAAARGADYSNDHFEVNDSAKTREYVFADDVAIWLVSMGDLVSTKPVTVTEWLAYVRTDQGRAAMFHFDLAADGRVGGVEEQYFP